MATTIFDVSPAPAASPSANGDVTTRAIIPNATVPAVTSNNMRMGTEILKVGWNDHVPFMRFELDMPEGSKIKALLLTMKANSVRFANAIPRVSGGWLVPQTSGFGWNWQRDIGVSAWPTQASAPYSQWWNGTGFSNDLTVWHGGAAGFSGTSLTTLGGTGGGWTLGDGITGYNNVTGLVAQLQSYFDAQESLRGTGDTGDGIPCMYMMQQIHTVNPTINQNQGFSASDNSLLIRRPTLTIEWDPPPAAELASTTAIDIRGTIDGNLRSELAATTALDADAEVVVSGAAELFSQTTLDVDAISGLCVKSTEVLEAGIAAANLAADLDQTEEVGANTQAARLEADVDFSETLTADLSAAILGASIRRPTGCP